MRTLRAFVAALSYFSILPATSSDGVPDDEAIAFLPIVGAMIGALAGFSAWTLRHAQDVLRHAQDVLRHAQDDRGIAIVIGAAIAAWIVSIALSGAIHVDGFLDCCDGLFAMVTPEKRLEIMHDPRHGTYAIVGMAMLTVLWLYALMGIPAPDLVAALAYSAMIARLASIARSPLIERSSLAARIVMWTAFLLFTLYFVERSALWTAVWLAIAVVISRVFAWFASSRVGRLNGDCYGASIVITEVTMLLAFPYLTALR